MNRIFVCSVVLAFLAPAFLMTNGGAQTAPEGAVVVTDPAGDVGVTGLVPMDNPSKRLVDHIDIVRFQVGPDDLDSIPLAVSFAGRDSTESTAGRAASVSDAYCFMDLRYRGQSDMAFTLYFRTSDLVPDEGPTWTSSLRYRYDGPGDRNSDSTDAGVTTTWDPDTVTLHLDIAKSFLPVFPGPRPAGKGDTLVIGWVYCYTDTALYLNHSDYLDGEVVYPLLSGGAGSTVSMSFADAARRPDSDADAATWSFPTDATGGPPTTSVAPGRHSVIPVRLENHAEEKKLVLLDAEPLDPAAKGWNLSIAESIFLKAGEVRTVNLIATPPSDAAIGNSIDIRIRSELAAMDETGEVLRRLVVSPVFGEENPTIHFHTRPRQYTEPTTTVYSVTGARHDFMVSLRSQIEGWPGDLMESTAFRSQWGYDHLDPTAAPVRLLAEQPATFQVAVTGEEGSEISLNLYVGTEELGYFYRLSTTAAPGTHTFSIPGLLDEDTVLPAGTKIAVDFSAYTRGPTKVGIDPKSTHITLPVRDEASNLNLTDGRFIPNLVLADGEEDLTYVNRGKEYAFELMLANDGVEVDDRRVTAVLENGTDWSVKILPGAQFRIDPGTSTPVAIAVVAGEAVPEHETAVIKVKATSKKDPNAHSSLTIKAIATAGADIDAKPYEEKEDQLPPLTEEKESPAPLGLLAVLALLGSVARRRVR